MPDSFAKNGITTETLKNVLIDDAVIYINYGETTGEKILSATKGGVKFLVNREYRDIEVDGARGVIKGLRRIIKESASIEGSLLEVKLATIQAMLPGTSTANYPTATPTHDEISSTGQIKETDYFKNIAVVGKISGSDKPFVGIIYNAIGESDFAIDCKDKDEATLDTKFIATFDPTNLTSSIWKIRLPKIV